LSSTTEPTKENDMKKVQPKLPTNKPSTAPASKKSWPDMTFDERIRYIALDEGEGADPVAGTLATAHRDVRLAVLALEGTGYVKDDDLLGEIVASLLRSANRLDAVLEEMSKGKES
jgi:hypothetical protein